MNPGELKHRITFLKKSDTVRDELGGKLPTSYTDAFSMWAKKSERAASRRELRGENVNYIPVFFTVRTCTAGKTPDVTMRIRYKGQVYEILYISDVTTGYLQIETKMVTPL